MKEYTFKDIEIGLEESFEFNINDEKMKMFYKISGDNNPLHTDIEFANENGYDENVVYGQLTASALSTLAGVYLPGKYSLIHSIETKFIKPVFISNMPLKVTGKVIEKDDRFKQITIKYHITDNTNTKVSRGVMKIGLIN